MHESTYTELEGVWTIPLLPLLLIEPRSPGPVTNNLLIRPISQLFPKISKLSLMDAIYELQQVLTNQLKVVSVENLHNCFQQ